MAGLEKKKIPIRQCRRQPDSQMDAQEPEGSSSTTPTRASDLKVQPRRMLDLYAGTGSVGDVFRDLGYEVVSLDCNPKFKPTITVDVMQWDYRKNYPPQYFDVIACSPPCTEFSTAMTCRPRQLEHADMLVQKALEIIDYFQPELWFLENPRLGLLKSRAYMVGIPFVDIDYCQVALWGYCKPTRFWGSMAVGSLPSLICDPRTCENTCVRQNGWRGHRKIIGATTEPGWIECPWKINKGCRPKPFGTC